MDPVFDRAYVHDKWTTQFLGLFIEWDYLGAVA